MKNKKIYWRLAFVLSLLPAIVWSLWLVNGESPLPQIHDHWYRWIYDMFPLQMANRWWDIPGMFLIVITIHNISLAKIWNPKPQGFLQGLLYVLVVAICLWGLAGFLACTASTNLFIGYIVAMVIIYISTGILYIAQQIPSDWSSSLGKWILQKDKEDDNE